MNLNKSIEHVVVLMAMEEEARPIIKALELTLCEPNMIDSVLPFLCFQSKKTDSAMKGPTITLMISGSDPRYDVDNIGTQAATLMAYVAIQSFSPDLIINAGTAGGFAKLDAKVGTVYLSDKEFIFHDRQVPLSGFDESGIGCYPALNVRHMARQLALPFGVISTGSSLKKSDQDILVIESRQAVAKEMEAAAIAWVCWLHQQAFVAVKSITNLLDEEGASEQQFLENLSTASQCLSEQLQKVINFCIGRTLTQIGQPEHLS